ncbi:GLE1 [Mytilus edulis]|uniref:mRNA export factor GLE1 n=1 Tax=Mytilus edulis TaxID=6550 RepID=A0A8S3UYP4_MYTED|nr:GLE1 [Mytilus edulis]
MMVTYLADLFCSGRCSPVKCLILFMLSYSNVEFINVCMKFPVEFFEHCSPPPTISKRFDNSPNNRLTCTDHVLDKHLSPEYTKSILAVKEYENSLDKEIKMLQKKHEKLKEEIKRKSLQHQEYHPPLATSTPAPSSTSRPATEKGEEQLCPYTVPYHISKTDGQSREDFYKSLGYKYDSEGNAEKQDQFLKRMSGLMRLYASVMVAHPPRGPNPYGTEHAWEWLSMVMNIEPLPDITATMTFDLLEVTGHALYRDYRKQFVKLLHVLAKEFFPKLKRMASPSGGGPISRLEDFLQNSLRKNGNIRPPEGLLNQHFWMT